MFADAHRSALIELKQSNEATCDKSFLPADALDTNWRFLLLSRLRMSNWLFPRVVFCDLSLKTVFG